jgi:VWFA-related protein
MRALIRVLSLIGIVALVPCSASAQADERTVFVSVVDKNDAPVAGLGAGDFVVREDEISREVLRVSAATEPMQIALLVDTSAAIDRVLLDLRLAVRDFVKTMAGKHEVALIGIGERPTVLVDYTKDPARLEKGIGSIFARADSGMYLLEAMIESANGVRKRKATRSHIVAIAARGPEFSESYHQHVLDVLRESNATFHSLMLTRTSAGVGKEEQELAMTVAEGTRMTGGRRDDILTSLAFGDRLRSLAAELNGQYQVAYARPRTLIPPKAMEVTSKRPDVTVRARRWP